MALLQATLLFYEGNLLTMLLWLTMLLDS